MKLIPGNYYKSRLGQKVLCIGKVKHSPYYQTFIHEYLGNDEFNWNYMCTDSNGRYLGNIKSSGFDIVADWDEFNSQINDDEYLMLKAKLDNLTVSVNYIYEKIASMEKRLERRIM